MQRDHPRSRGEYSGLLSEAPPGVGSSPLSRGIRRQNGAATKTWGIIPALAGNTRRGLRGVRRGRDHPRSRGEYLVEDPGRGETLGSSPLSRGILSRVTSSRIHSGIIPALAGNTSKSTRPPLLGRDHLRSRGEYVSLPSTPHMIVGSSPLSRGIPVAILSCQVGPRIIPALAGNTRGRLCGRLIWQDHPRSRGEY